jgi:uncharacterized membrane protein SpoIIM required for sporulation
MSADQLRSRRFRDEREEGWRQLEDLLSRLERGSLAKLSDAELLAIPKLYRATLSALSVARATSLDQSLTEYLEDLGTRAYFLVYGTRTGLWRRLLAFFAVDWPRAAQALWRETLLAWLLTCGGVALAWALTVSDPTWFYVFVPGGLAGGRDPTATTAILRETLYSDGMLAHAGLFATYLFTHNAGIAIMAFALGFAFCLPSALLLVYNGATVGAFAALFASRGLLVPLGGWLLVHGVTELTAVVLSGAAGLRIGAAIAAPGASTRLAAASAAGKQAATLMAGVFVMLLCAGVLEGIVRQAVRDDTQRYAIAALTGIAWFTYLYLPRRVGP